MRLENKFFTTFFYPFLFCIISSIIIAIVILSFFSKGYLDKTTANDVYKVETKYAKNNIYSASILLTDLLLKVKLVVEEQLSLFEFIEKSLNLSENNTNRKIKDIYNVWDTPKNNEELKKDWIMLHYGLLILKLKTLNKIRIYSTNYFFFL